MESVAPRPGFSVRVQPPNSLPHYINVTSHPAVDRPLAANDWQVDVSHMERLGIDNLRVPLLVGPTRSVVLSRDSEALATDVVFNCDVLRLALSSIDATEQAMQLAPGPLIRSRLVELAIQNVEDELGCGPLGRDFELQYGAANYWGGTGKDRMTAVPLRTLQMLHMSKCEEQAVPKAAPTGPWRSERAKAERTSGHRPGGGPTMKPGFLSGAGGALYPDGSSEGMHPEGAGDPLGWMPKGLRSRVGVVDTRHTPEAQRSAVEAHINTPRLVREREGAAPEPSGERARGGAGGGGAAAGRGAPRYALEEDGSGGVVLTVDVPGVSSMDNIEVDVSDAALSLRAEGFEPLFLAWPRPVDAARATAKFRKLKQRLVVRCPGLVR